MEPFAAEQAAAEKVAIRMAARGLLRAAVAALEQTHDGLREQVCKMEGLRPGKVQPPPKPPAERILHPGVVWRRPLVRRECHEKRWKAELPLEVQQRRMAIVPIFEDESATCQRNAERGFGCVLGALPASG